MSENQGLGGSGMATEQDAAAVMPDIEQLEQQQGTARERNSDGTFKKAAEQAVQDDAGDADQSEGDKEGSGEEQQAESQDGDRHDEDQLFIELPGENEGDEPLRLAVDDVLAGYRKAQDLEKQVEELQKPAVAPQQWDQAIMEAVQKGVQYEQTLAQMQQFIMPRQPDDQLLNPNSNQYDPEKYFLEKQEFDGKLQQYQQLEQERQRVNQENATQTQALMAARFDREQAKLHEVWPEIQEEATAQTVRDDLGKYYALDDETIDSVVDHRFYAMAKDALAYRKQATAAKTAAKVVKAKPKIIKSQARQKQAPRNAQALNRMRSEPNEDTAMDALGAFLENVDK